MRRPGFFLFVCFAATSPTSAGWNWPAPSDLAESDLRYVWSTHYYVHAAQPSTATNAIPLIDRQGRSLGVKLSPRDFCYAAMEGTVAVTFDDRSETFNAGGVGSRQLADCTPFFPRSNARFAVGRQRFFKISSDAPFGLGISGYRLVPFRTVATDRDFIKPGTVLYLPTLRGLRFTEPSGQQITHDGYVFAADVGGSIKRCHIDFFGGTDSRSAAFPFTSGKRHPRPLKAYIVRNPTIVASLYTEHALRPAGAPAPAVNGCRASVIGPQED